jgi:adenylosuccinate lyase
MCAQTHSSQWLERTLDDSAIRRMIIPESFLATDTIIHTMIKIMSDIIVWPNVIKNRIKSELPFMATEVILMKCVQNGGDRQDIHEALRKHSMEASRQVKEYGKENDLLERIKSDILFESIHDDLDSLLDPKLFIGRSSEQVTEFLEENILL